jgi:hypothetical protein
MDQNYAPDGEDLYSDAGMVTAPSEEEAPPAEPAEKAEQDEKGEEKTALLPKSIFMGKDLKPGSRCEIEIVKAHEDEIEVKYVKHQAKPEPEAAEMAELME